MFFILLGILGVAICLWVMREKGMCRSLFWEALAILSLSIGLVVGLFVPIAGFNEPMEVKVSEILEIGHDTVYYDMIPSEEYEGAYHMVGVPTDDIDIAVVNEIESSTLHIYEVEARKTFWSFALFQDRTEYVLHVSIDTYNQYFK